jgi:hypothetical protein
LTVIGAGGVVTIPFVSELHVGRNTRFESVATAMITNPIVMTSCAAGFPKCLFPMFFCLEKTRMLMLSGFFGLQPFHIKPVLA